jgi:glycosyltransferase involved in cell wall biosynthesis
MSGLPVVSTRHAGIKDVVIEGETGFLVDESDIDGMAMHMLALAQNADLAGQMGQRAREHVAANFPMERHIEQLYDVLRQA